MRLAKLQQYLVDLENLDEREEWDAGLDRIRKIQSAIRSGHLSGRKTDFRVARDSICKSLESAVNAHEAATRASDELAIRQEMSTSTRRIIEKLDQDILDSASFIDEEAFEDEKANLSDQLDRLISERNRTVSELEKVESDWPELSELERIARIQSETSLSLVEEILEEVKRIHSGVDDA